MATKTVKFTPAGIAKLLNDKPAIYRIQTESGRTNYIGSAQRGRVRERLKEHLPGAKDAVPGAKVRVQQAHRIDAARRAEGLAIARSKPTYNDQGK